MRHMRKGVIERDIYLSNKKKISEKIEKMQEEYEQIQVITTETDDLLSDIKVVEQNAEEVKFLNKMTSHNFPRACFPYASMVKMHNFQLFWRCSFCTFCYFVHFEPVKKSL